MYIEMKKKAGLLSIMLLLTIPFVVSAQNNRRTDGYFTTDSISKGGYTLVIINKDSLFNKDVLKRMEETFFTVYPKLVKRFNEEAARKVVFVIEPRYDGVAAVSSGRVVFNPHWFKQHPGDIDVVTHEVMHIVQDYGNTPGPFWLTEGIADYVRHIYGVDNSGAGWSMPDVTGNHSYTNAYRITARFLVWAEQRKDRQIVDKLDEVMRDHTYQEEIWEKLTGKTLDELWSEYVSDPEIES